MSWLSEVYSELKDPGRALTKGEVEFARDYFGDEIDYSKVRLRFNRRAVHFYISVVERWAAETVGNNITFNSKYYRKTGDVTGEKSQKTDPDARFILLHELAHVWQEQQGHTNIFSGLKLSLKTRFNYAAAYRFDLYGPEKFLELNYEQQAGIVEHMAKAKNELKEALANPGYPYRDVDISQFRDNVELYRKKIGNALPLK